VALVFLGPAAGWLAGMSAAAVVWLGLGVLVVVAPIVAVFAPVAAEREATLSIGGGFVALNRPAVLRGPLVFDTADIAFAAVDRSPPAPVMSPGAWRFPVTAPARRRFLYPWGDLPAPWSRLTVEQPNLALVFARPRHVPGERGIRRFLGTGSTLWYNTRGLRSGVLLTVPDSAAVAQALAIEGFCVRDPSDADVAVLEGSEEDRARMRRAKRMTAATLVGAAVALFLGHPGTGGGAAGAVVGCLLAGRRRNGR